MVTPPSLRARRRLGWMLMCLGAGGALAAGALVVTAQRGASPMGARGAAVAGGSGTPRAVVASGSAPALAPIRPRLAEGSVIAHLRLGASSAPLTVVEGRAQPGTLGHDASTAYPGEPHSMLLVAGPGLSFAAPGDGSEVQVVAGYGVYRYRVVETHVVGGGGAAGPQVPGLRLVVPLGGGTRVTAAELLAQDPDGQAELSQETAVALAQASFAGTAGAAPVAGHLLWPCSGPITQAFGPTSYGFEFPYVYQGVSYPHFHTGVDVGVGLGTPISAAADGVVVLAGTNVVGGTVVGYGTYVVVAHGGGLYTLYGHLSRLEVAAGDHVRAGQVIGLSGSTGNSTGPHLHFEVRVGAEPVDPTPYLP